MKLEEMTTVTVHVIDHDDELDCNETGRNDHSDCILDHDDELDGYIMKLEEMTIVL